MRLIALTLLAIGCGGSAPVAEPTYGEGIFECRVLTADSRASPVDLLLVVDRSAAMGAHVSNLLAQLGTMTDALAAGVHAHYHIGVVAADDPRLTRGCELGGGRNFIDWDQVGGYSNLPQGRTVADSWRCLTPRLPSTAAQTPVDTALRALSQPLIDNREFRRADATLVVLFVSSAEHAEPRPTDEYRAFFSRAITVAALPESAHLPLLPLREQVLLDDADWSPLISSWASGQVISSLRACVPAPLAHRDHPDCVVTDWEHQRSGIIETVLPDCTQSRFARPCWRLELSNVCPLSSDQLQLVIDRPPGELNHHTAQAACACLVK